ncbi:MAG: DUF3179 domain-containing protein [Ardenticatenia bacterium]|nr:DUF3179 domain-containing protein [Ardenticatenia bacterium]
MKWWSVFFSGFLLLLLAGCGVQRGQPTRSLSPPSTSRTAVPTPTVPSGDPPPLAIRRQFRTDFTKYSVPYSEIISGGVPKDGIPAIDDPVFVRVEEANAWLNPMEPVIFFSLGNDARAYPIQILIWHEIVNDVVDEVPVLITFCPLCNTAIAFLRTVNGQVLDFGTTGLLRYSNLIMYDRQTESWWQQITGEAIVGELTGTTLDFLPASIISWEEFKSIYPEGQVLSRETGYSRPYGENPYAGYDDINRSPFLYVGPETPKKLLPMARVLSLDLNGESVVYPYEILEQVHVVNDTVGGEPVVVFWHPGTASPLDAPFIAEGRDVGAAAAFRRTLNGRTLTFTLQGERLVDEETGSEWTVVGRAVSGPLKGQQLESLVAITQFWFSRAAFNPDTRIYGLPER